MIPSYRRHQPGGKNAAHASASPKISAGVTKKPRQTPELFKSTLRLNPLGFVAPRGEGLPASPMRNHSAAAGVTNTSSTDGGSRFGASFSSAICASFSRASWASRCRFHMLA